jgi:tetratricopeptide (TPR) repeat protein
VLRFGEPKRDSFGALPSPRWLDFAGLEPGRGDGDRRFGSLPAPVGEWVMKGYRSRDVARMFDLPIEQVRSYARTGLLQPDRDRNGEYLFSFQDLVLLRTVKGLSAQQVPTAKVRKALTRIKSKLPADRPLSGVQVLAEGDEVWVREGDSIWNPDSGQTRLNFEARRHAEVITPRASDAAPLASDPPCIDLEADEWFGLGTDLENAAPDHAREAYRRTLELDPNHVEARVNLGRLLHEIGRLRAAEAHYRLVLRVEPRHATALFNLGVSLEDSDRDDEAIEAYRATIDSDPACADAYFNLARLHEKAGRKKKAEIFREAYLELISDD